MSDIFREIQEDVRRERIEKLWKAYGVYAIAFLVLVFMGLGAWQLWQRHEKAEAEKASVAFAAAQRITNPQAAANAFADLTKGTPAGYRRLARLFTASAKPASLSDFDRIFFCANPLMQHQIEDLGIDGFGQEVIHACRQTFLPITLKTVGR